MTRLFALILNLLVTVVLKILFQGDVSVVVDTPTEVVAGNEFEVQITIEKGNLESFSRLLQNLPAGLTASSIETSNADFEFDDKRARFIWLRMPDEKQFTVSYKIKVDPRLKGNFNIDGKFSYIDENERRSVNVSSNEINILPSPDIDPSLIVDIKDFESLIIPKLTASSGELQIACIRQIPQVASDGSYIITLLVNKERKEKFAKIEEKIPAGFTVEAIKERDAIFTYKKKTAKFLWMNLPASSFFLVSYKLVPYNKFIKSPEITGKFSYLEKDKTVSINIQQTEADLAQIKSPEELNNLLLGLSEVPLASKEVPDVITKQIDTQTETKSTTTSTTASKTKTSQRIRSNQRYKLEPEDGIYYRVQLAAGHNPVNVKRYFRKYKLDKEVRAEEHQGWHKYSVGSFNEYKVARDYRVHIWNTTVIDDAFVSAYNNGKRITVQEALMVANQKWYK
jgi:hypothetical protein